MSDAIDELLDSIEKMIDAQDDMWEEEKYSNYRQVIDIRENRYAPAKDAARAALQRAIAETVRAELEKHAISG